MYDSPGLFLIPSSLLYWMDTKYGLDINGVGRLSLVAFQNNLTEKNKYRPKKGAFFKTKLKSYIFNIINNTLGGYYSNLSNSTYPSHIIHCVCCTFPVWYICFLNIFFMHNTTWFIIKNEMYQIGQMCIFLFSPLPLQQRDNLILCQSAYFCNHFPTYLVFCGSSTPELVSIFVFR